MLKVKIVKRRAKGKSYSFVRIYTDDYVYDVNIRRGTVYAYKKTSEGLVYVSSFRASD